MIVACKGRRSYFSLKSLYPPPPMNIVLQTLWIAPRPGSGNHGKIKRYGTCYKRTQKYFSIHHRNLRIYLIKLRPDVFQLRRREMIRHSDPFLTASSTITTHSYNERDTCFRSHTRCACVKKKHYVIVKKTRGWIWPGCLSQKKKVGGAACNWSYILSEVGMFPAPEISDAWLHFCPWHSKITDVAVETQVHCAVANYLSFWTS